MVGMFSRLNDAMNLLLLRFGEWLEDLSPTGKFLMFLVVFSGLALLFKVGNHFGAFPHKSIGHYVRQ